MMPPAVTLPGWLCRECIDHGRRMVGRIAATKHFSPYMPETDPDMLIMSRIGECAVCLWAGLDPMTALDWEVRPYHGDGGTDLVTHGARLDVKSTKMHYRYLIWPRWDGKDCGFQRKQFDALVLAKVAAPDAVLMGWIAKERFAATRQEAGPGHRLAPGTWFVDQSALIPMHVLCWRWW